MSKAWLFLVPVLGVALGAGCSGSSGDDDDDDDAITFAPGEITYYEDVLPMVMENCQACHTDPGLAVALDDYSVASQFANAMAARTDAREMPPWPPDPSCGMPLKNERLLDDVEKAMFAAWAADGAPEGNPANAPTPTPTPAPTPAADLVLDWGAEYVYDGSPSDLYMCFPVEPMQAIDLVKAQIYPGNPRAVHHVILYRDSGGADGNTTPYECGGFTTADFLLGWAPGSAPLTFDDGVGMPIAADDKLVMQVHYHGTGQEEIDRTTVGIWGGTVTQEARVVWGGGVFGSVPGNETVSGTCAMNNQVSGAVLLGMSPHMHQKGMSYSVNIERAGEEPVCAMEIPDWDFEWQGGYFYQEPVTLEAGDKINLTCRWEPGSAGTPFGEGTEDEMCFLFIYMIEEGYVPQYCIAL